MFSTNKEETETEPQNAPKKEKRARGKYQRQHLSRPKRVAKLIYQIPAYSPQVFQPMAVAKQTPAFVAVPKPPTQKPAKAKETQQKADLTEVPTLIKEQKIGNGMPAIPCFDIVRRGNLPCISFWHDKVDVIYNDDIPTVNYC